MVKKAHLQPYLTSCELKTRYLSTSDRVESVEKHLLWLVSQGWTIQQASQSVGIQALTNHHWWTDSEALETG